IAIVIPAVPDCANAINNLSGLIEFKTYLGQVAEVAVGIRAYHKGNLRFGEPDFRCRFHRHISGSASVAVSRFLVDSLSVLELLLCAKHLFFAAMVPIALPGGARMINRTSSA